MEIEKYDNRKFSEKYETQKKLGEGSFGYVYKAIEKENNSPIAIKRIKTERSDDIDILREFSVMQALKEHPNIVNLQKLVIFGGKIHFIMDYVDQNLLDYISSIPEYMDTKLIKSYSYQIFNGISYCHSHQIIHRDIKTSNILIDGRGCLKIADFGSAKKLVEPCNEYDTGTTIYHAPEIIMRFAYSFEIDIWAIGCVLFEMKTKKHPFYPKKNLSNTSLMYDICKILGTPEDVQKKFSDIPKFEPQKLSNIMGGSDEINDLIEQCFKFKPNERISSKDALKHAYFNDLADDIKKYFTYREKTDTN